MHLEDDYYEILGVDREATQAEITKQWKKMVSLHHPDKITDPIKKKEGEEKLKEINNINDTLKDKNKREKYDKELRESEIVTPFNCPPGFPPGFFGGGYYQHHYSSQYNNPYMNQFYNGFQDDDSSSSNNDYSQYEEEKYPKPNVDPDELFDKYFGEIIKENKIKKNTVKLKPINVDVELTLEEIYAGVELKDEIRRLSFCKKCKGTAYPDGIEHKCSHCDGGDVMIVKRNGPGSFTKTQTDCTKCNGFGDDMSIPRCTHCVNGLAYENYKISHVFQPGVDTRDVINMGFIGHKLQKNRYADSDRSLVEIVVTEADHPVFKRGVIINDELRIQDLALELEIPLHDALCGFTKKIKGLDGSDLLIESQCVIKDGEMRIIKGKGLPYEKNPEKFGDILVIFKIVYPEKFDQSVKSKIYEFLTGEKFKTKKIPKNLKPEILNDVKPKRKYRYGYKMKPLYFS